MIIGKSEVELKKQSKTKRRKNQKMELKEKWICPDAEVQRFTPQEYIATCYRITVHCNSKELIRVNGTNHSHSGGIHYPTSFYLSSNSENQVISIMQSKNWQSAQTGKNNGAFNNGDAINGYAWQENGVWHFTTTTTKWFDAVWVGPPNVS